MSNRLSGTLLCRAGDDRFAFAAQDVASIESPSTFGGLAGSASAAFRSTSVPGRILVAVSGEGVGVEALEIDAEPRALLPTPGVLARIAGGSVRGFILVRGALWPVLSLVDFGRFLAPTSREAA